MHDLWHYIWCMLKTSLLMSFSMAWEIFWALVLGFALSAIVQAIVTKREMNKWLADNSFKSLSIATVCGAASSSCSYAAAAIARALVKQGADFTAAMVFQFASTNLVLELSILLFLLLGWQYTAGQFIGGIIMIALMSLIFRLFLPQTLISSAVDQARKDIAGPMEGHASMDMSPSDQDCSLNNKTIVDRIISSRGKTAISHYFFMDWASLWPDIVFGLLIAGALSVLIPDSAWTTLLCKDNPTLAHWLNPLVGPLIAVLSFVCSIGNVPMAAVLWHEGMTFGGVLSFLFADLIVLPLLDIYRKYYGFKMASFLAVSFYLSMVAAAYSCSWLFAAIGILPNAPQTMPGGIQTMITPGIALNYTTVFNIVALFLVMILFNRFIKTGGPKMLNMMSAHSKGPDKTHCH